MLNSPRQWLTLRDYRERMDEIMSRNANNPDNWEEEIDAVEIDRFLNGLNNSTEGHEVHWDFDLNEPNPG